MQLLPRARSPSPAAVATWAFFPGHLERVERTALHRTQKRSALVRAGGLRKRKKQLSRNQVPFQCPLEKCFQGKHCLGSQGQDLDHCLNKKVCLASPLQLSSSHCPACSHVSRTGRGTSWDSPPHPPLHLSQSSFSFPLPSSPFLPPPPHSPSRPCFPDSARALRTPEGTARPLQWTQTLLLRSGPLGDLYGRQSIHSQCSRSGQCGPLAGPGPRRIAGDPNVKSIGFRAAHRGWL